MHQISITAMLFYPFPTCFYPIITTILSSFSNLSVFDLWYYFHLPSPLTLPFSLQQMEVVQIAPFPSLSELSAHTALPSQICPSDHVAVVVDVKFIE